jgi:tetratricopeptide (TPR) repeat protein
VTALQGDEVVTGPPAHRAATEALTESERRTLAYASAVGREFDFPLLALALGRSEEELAEEMERLVERGHLRERPGGERFAFVHDEMRVQTYQSLTESRRRVVHRRLGEAMEKRYPDPPPEVLPELGRHFFLGKVPDRSIAYNRRAAEAARLADRPEQAAHHLERALADLRALPGTHEDEEVALEMQVGDLYYSLGDMGLADEHYTRGIARARGHDRRLKARLLLSRAEVARDNDDFPGARQFAREARALFEEAEDFAGLGSVHRILGRVHFHRGTYLEGIEEEMVAFEFLRRAADERLLGRWCTDVANLFSMLGPDYLEEASRFYRRAIERLVRVEDWSEVARAHANFAVLVGDARPGDALEHLERSREFAEKAHESRWKAWSLFLSVEYRLAVGQVEEAERENEQAKRLLEHLVDPMGHQQVTINSGLLYERRGRWEEAESAYRSALAQAERLGLRAEAAECEYHLAKLWFKTGDLRRAREVLDQADRAGLAQLKPSLREPLRQLRRSMEDAERSAGVR